MEPAGAKHYSGICPMEEDYREEAVIAAPGTETFREFVLFAHSGNRLLDKDGNLIKTTEQGMEPGEEGGHEAPDHEDTGEKGYNYRSERFFNRLQRVPLIYKVFNSHVHGDPATPVFQTIFPIGTGAKTPHPCRLLGVFWPIASRRNCCGKRLGIL